MSQLKGREHVYTIDDNWQSTSGTCKWLIGKCESEKYFIKQYLEPKWPDESKKDMYSSQAIMEMKAECFEWENEQKKIVDKLSDYASPSGNLVVPIEVFHDNTTYYKVNYAVEDVYKNENKKEIIRKISNLSIEDKLLILKTVATSIQTLHNCKIVHGDLKPENILISKSPVGKLIGKVIDFDDSYFENNVPSPESIKGSQPYYSPELGKYVQSADIESTISSDEYRMKISCKSDIFALGIIFHEYLVGAAPDFDKSKQRYAWGWVFKGNKLGISKKIPEHLQKLIEEMLELNPEKRPDISTVAKQLTVTPPLIPDPPRKPRGETYAEKLPNGKYRVYVNGSIKGIISKEALNRDYPGIEIRGETVSESEKITFDSPEKGSAPKKVETPPSPSSREETYAEKLPNDKYLVYVNGTLKGIISKEALNRDHPGIEIRGETVSESEKITFDWPEKGSTPKKVEDSTTPARESNYAEKLPNGKYRVYVNGTLKGIISEDSLNATYPKIEIRNK